MDRSNAKVHRTHEATSKVVLDNLYSARGLHRLSRCMKDAEDSVLHCPAGLEVFHNYALAPYLVTPEAG